MTKAILAARRIYSETRVLHGRLHSPVRECHRRVHRRRRMRWIRMGAEVFVRIALREGYFYAGVIEARAAAHNVCRRGTQRRRRAPVERRFAPRPLGH